MASIRKIERKTGTVYRVQLYSKGTRTSRVFATKKLAQIWAEENGDAPTDQVYTLKDVLEKYQKEITPTKRGARWEAIRINAFVNHPKGYALPLNKKINLVTTQDIAKFRDFRLGEVSAGSVLRELGILSAVFERARKEWHLMTANPIADLTKPAAPKHRERLIRYSEIKNMLRELDYSPKDKNIVSFKQCIAVCFLLALRTGMRAGELHGLKWSDVSARSVHLELDKIGNSREVPLSKKAVRTLNRMKKFDTKQVFGGLKKSTMDAMFRSARQRAGLTGFTFHDSRHTAATWMAKRMKNNPDVSAQQAVLDLCKIFGWTDVSRALVYYNPNPEDVANRLD
jgi:hypothetical protein